MILLTTDRLMCIICFIKWFQKSERSLVIKYWLINRMVVEIITPKVLFIPALLSPPGRGEDTNPPSPGVIEGPVWTAAWEW